MSGARSRRPPSRPSGWHRLEPEWADRIVRAALFEPGDLVVDLGAGTGALTRPLCRSGTRVVAVELDAGRAARLRREFALEGVRVVQVDLRLLSLPRVPFRVVASPPYALTAETLRLLLSTERLLSADVVLQGSAAERLVASGVRARQACRYRLSLGLSVPRRAFSPPPRVDSVVLQVRRR